MIECKVLTFGVCWSIYDHGCTLPYVTFAFAYNVPTLDWQALQGISPEWAFGSSQMYYVCCILGEGRTPAHCLLHLLSNLSKGYQSLCTGILCNICMLTNPFSFVGFHGNRCSRRFWYWVLFLCNDFVIALKANDVLNLLEAITCLGASFLFSWQQTGFI